LAGCKSVAVVDAPGASGGGVRAAVDCAGAGLSGRETNAIGERGPMVTAPLGAGRAADDASGGGDCGG
jgi:hypothetical protein